TGSETLFNNVAKKIVETFFMCVSTDSESIQALSGENIVRCDLKLRLTGQKAVSCVSTRPRLALADKAFIE
ncbi:hypothetical protein QQM79_21135, partial [Marinobacteraceae bacterium S3BR75-40.1]